MFYQFRCRKHGDFEVRQPIDSEHKAECPECGVRCKRVYLPLKHTWADRVFREDGSFREDKDYAPVMRG